MKNSETVLKVCKLLAASLEPNVTAMVINTLLCYDTDTDYDTTNLAEYVMQTLCELSPTAREIAQSGQFYPTAEPA